MAEPINPLPLSPRVMLDNAFEWADLNARQHSSTNPVEMATMFAILSAAQALVTMYEESRRTDG